jgi:hypothetical protein
MSSFRSNLSTEQSVDNVKAHVDTRRYPSRTDHASIIHEAARGVNERVRGKQAQLVDGAVVRRGFQPVEQGRLRQ